MYCFDMFPDIDFMNELCASNTTTIGPGLSHGRVRVVENSLIDTLGSMVLFSLEINRRLLIRIPSKDLGKVFAG